MEIGNRVYLKIADPINDIEFDGVICSIEYSNLGILLHLSNGKKLMVKDLVRGYRIFYGNGLDNQYKWECITCIPNKYVELIINDIKYA